jgi:flagellar protein FliS
MQMLNKKPVQTNNPTNLTPQQKKFVKNMVDSASPEQLIVILYNGCLQWLAMAKKELEKNKEERVPNWTNFSHQMKMSVSIIEHLQDSLNHDINQQFADQLFNLYEFLKSNLMRSNIEKNQEKMDFCIKIISDLKNGWQEGINKLNEKATQESQG